MLAEIIMPEVGAARVILSTWFAEIGEEVFEGDRLVEVVLDGATFDVAASGTGRLVMKKALPNDSLRTGQLLGLIDVDNSVVREGEDR